MLIKTPSILVLIFLAIFININGQTSEWELEKNQDGIKIFTRKTDEFPVKEFKAIVTIHTDLNTLIDILNDVENYPKWMTDCLYAKTIKQVNENERFDYATAQVPWPLSDRDMIWHFVLKMDNEKKEYIASSTSEPDYIGKMKGFERLKKSRGLWKFKEIENNVQVTYMFAGDPGVPVPNWIINMFIVDGPFKTLTNLRKLAEEE